MLNALLNARRKAIRGLNVFNINSFIAGERLRRESGRSTLSELSRNQDRCFCIGTGPSLDRVDLREVRDSTVLLLNGAYRRHEELQGNNNRLYWFAHDNQVILNMISEVPESYPRILTVYKFLNIESFRPHFRPHYDVFLQPRPKLRDPATADPDRSPHISVWPGLFTDLDAETYQWDLRRRFHVALRSVAFSAIFFALHFNFERIIALGMDLPDGRSPHVHARGCRRSLQGRGFGTEARDPTCFISAMSGLSNG